MSDMFFVLPLVPQKVYSDVLSKELGCERFPRYVKHDYLQTERERGRRPPFRRADCKCCELKSCPANSSDVKRRQKQS